MRFFLRGFPGCVWQSRELRLIGDMQGEVLVLLEQIPGEAQSHETRFLGQLAQLPFSFLGKQRTAPHEAVIGFLQQHFLLGRELPVVLIYVLHPLEKLGVEHDVVSVLREQRA